MPARPLTAEEEWLLDECIDYAEMRIAHMHVLAAKIARGEVGPSDYYMIDALDAKDAEHRRDVARMQADLKRRAHQ